MLNFRSGNAIPDLKLKLSASNCPFDEVEERDSLKIMLQNQSKPDRDEHLSFALSRTNIGTSICRKVIVPQEFKLLFSTELFPDFRFKS